MTSLQKKFFLRYRVHSPKQEFFLATELSNFIFLSNELCRKHLCSNENIKHFDRLNRTTTKSALKRQIRFMFIIFYNLSGNAKLYL